MTKSVQSQFAKNLVGKARFNPRAEVEKFLDSDSWADFNVALMDPAVPVKAIVESLKECGIEVSASSIQRWRTDYHAKQV